MDALTFIAGLRAHLLIETAFRPFAIVIADRRLMPPRIDELNPGVAITPSLITNRFSPVPSHRKPRRLPAVIPTPAPART